jgi:hypothetical protein
MGGNSRLRVRQYRRVGVLRLRREIRFAISTPLQDDKCFDWQRKVEGSGQEL